MLFIYLLITIADSHASFFEETNNAGNLETNNAGNLETNNNIQYNPLCWVTNCEESSQKNQGNTVFSLDPTCWFTVCDEKHINKFNPYCWFKNCENKEDDNLWITDEQIINWCKEKLQKIQCLFKECPPPPVEKKEDLTIYDKLKNMLNSVKPQEPLIEHFLKFQWNPYCWYSECCNKESIPSDIKSKFYIKV